MRDTLICTVGTSLFGNLKNLSENTPKRPDNWERIKDCYDRQSWKDLAKELGQVDARLRICGAEINTVEEILKKGVKLKNLFLLVSDTEAGKNTGVVLKTYFESRLNVKVDYKVVEDLQDTEPRKFKSTGLRNLVKTIGEYAQRVGKEHVILDATGGYKAQIAVAVIIGQALDIPVYYKHECFSEIIDFPPLPISLDYDILGRNADILTLLERGVFLSDHDVTDMDEKLRVFLNEEEIDGTVCYELNAIGQIYLTAFRYRHPKAVNLKDLPDAERKPPTFGNDHHYPKGFKEFVNKVWSTHRWIKTCFTLPYDKQKGIRSTGFRVVEENNKYSIVGTYKEKDFGARFRVVLADESQENLNWAVVFLNQRYVA